MVMHDDQNSMESFDSGAKFLDGECANKKKL